MFFRACNAIIAPQLQKDLSLSPESLGALSAAFFYAFALNQVTLALLLDRIGARLIMSVLFMVGSVGAVVFAFAHSFEAAVAGRILLGLGMSGTLMGGMKLFTKWFAPRDFATATGLLVGLGTLGSMAASTPLALLVDAIGWRGTFGYSSLCTAFMACVFYFIVRDDPRGNLPGLTPAPRIPGSGRVRRLLLNRDYWLISCATFFRYGTLMSIQGLWAGPYLLQYLKLSPVQAGNLLMLITIGYVFGCSVGGWLSDKVIKSRKYVVIMGLLGMVIVDLCLTMSWGQSGTISRAIVFFALGVFPGFGNVTYSHIKEIMPPDMAGMALAGINFFTMLGVGVYIHVIGWLIERMGTGHAAGLEEYRAAFLLALAGMCLATVLYFFTREAHDPQR